MMQTHTQSPNKWGKSILSLAIALAVCTVQSVSATTEQRMQAKRIHDRLAGIPPSPEVLNDLEDTIQNEGHLAAAKKIMAVPGDSNYDPLYATSAKNFYNVTIKNMVTPWTNEAQTVFAPLNDYTATVIGMIRDDIPFYQVLSADIIYVGSGATGAPAYSMDNNAHYEYLEDNAIDLSNEQNLRREQQSSFHTDLSPGDTAGVLTTRAAARAFFIDGTNRAMFRFTLMNHLCTDLEPIKDTSRSPDRVQQDVSRSPGGDSRLYMTNCVGCHAGMDPLNQAFAYYNYQYNGDMDNGRLVYTPGSVQGKYLINADNFKYGYITTDDSWENYWREGPNAFLGWNTTGLAPNSSGYGAKSMGIELANSQAFASCQVKKVFKTVCFRDPSTNELTTIRETVLKPNYRMRDVFADAAVRCMGSN